jgi:hypothetical protein
VEIIDQGDPRIEHGHGDDRPHMLDKGARPAEHGNWESTATTPAT